MTKDSKLEASLLLMPLAIAAFLLVWAVDKVIAPEHAQAVFSHFYFSELSRPALKAIGIVQMVVIAAFAVGFARFWTYGAVLVMHTASTTSTYAQLLNPLGRRSAPVVVLGGGPRARRDDRAFRAQGPRPAFVG